MKLVSYTLQWVYQSDLNSGPKPASKWAAYFLSCRQQAGLHAESYFNTNAQISYHHHHFMIGFRKKRNKKKREAKAKKISFIFIPPFIFEKINNNNKTMKCRISFGYETN